MRTLLEDLGYGMRILLKSPDDILPDYEDLEREDVLAALAFAARLAQIKRIQPPAT